MKYSRVHLEAFGYELAPVAVSSAELEERLRPVYRQLHLQPGQLEAWTGIAERRWWEPNFPLSEGALRAARAALEQTNVAPDDLGTLIYAAVNREHFEPATACAVADGLGLAGDAAVYDVSNACLGVLNGMLEIANRIELGQIRAGLVTACETAREINEIIIGRLLADPRMERFAASLATFTGGSGAVAVLLTDGSFGGPPGAAGETRGRKLLGGTACTAPEFHRLCRWGVEPLNGDGICREFFITDSAAVLKHGVELGARTWRGFLNELHWRPEQVDKVIGHQVGLAHQQTILNVLHIPPEKDFATFPYLGNTGTVALPITAAIAEERGHLRPGDRVALLGIGSGLNCLMLGVEW